MLTGATARLEVEILKESSIKSSTWARQSASVGFNSPWAQLGATSILGTKISISLLW